MMRPEVAMAVLPLIGVFRGAVAMVPLRLKGRRVLPPLLRPCKDEQTWRRQHSAHF